MRARVAPRNADYSGLGEFRDAIQISYATGRCADAGITEESYVSSLGLVRRVFQTIAGPRAFDVVYVRLGGRVYASEPHAGIGLALDRTVYEIDPAKPIPQLTARLTIRNDHPELLELQFPSGQIYELRIENEGGEAVFLQFKVAQVEGVHVTRAVVSHRIEVEAFEHFERLSINGPGTQQLSF